MHKLQDTWKPAGGRRGVRACRRAFAAFGTISLVLVTGLPARAATPTRNPLDPIPDPGGDSGPDVFAWFVAALMVVGTIIAVYLVGRLVASLGGTPAERAGAEGRPQLLAHGVGGRLGQFLGSSTAVVLGWAAGVGMAGAAAKGGMATLGIAVLGIGIALACAAVILPALLAFKLRGAVSPAIATLLLAGALLPLGSVAGAAFGAPAPTPEPVVLEALGHVQADLTGGTFQHRAKFDASATCESEPDGHLVRNVFVGDLGELGSGTLRGSVLLIGEQEALVDVFIDGADLDGGQQPVWGGAVQVDSMSNDRSEGRVTLAGVPRVEPSEPDGMTWPDGLDGFIAWSCEPW